MRAPHEHYFLQIAKVVATRSTCPRRAVGALMVSRENTILSTGYNGVPAKFKHCIDYPCGGQDDAPGQTSRCLAVHAEQNAILQCKDTTLIHTLYVTVSPCFVCTKMLLNLPNLKRVVFIEKYPDERAERLWSIWMSRSVGNIYWKCGLPS